MGGKKSEGSAKYGRDMQRRCRVNEESPDPFALEIHADRSKTELHRTHTPHGATIEYHASVIRHLEG